MDTSPLEYMARYPTAPKCPPTPCNTCPHSQGLLQPANQKHHHNKNDHQLAAKHNNKNLHNDQFINNDNTLCNSNTLQNLPVLQNNNDTLTTVGDTLLKSVTTLVVTRVDTLTTITNRLTYRNAMKNFRRPFQTFGSNSLLVLVGNLRNLTPRTFNVTHLKASRGDIIIVTGPTNHHAVKHTTNRVRITITLQNANLTVRLPVTPETARIYDHAMNNGALRRLGRRVTNFLVRRARKFLALNRRLHFVILNTLNRLMMKVKLIMRTATSMSTMNHHRVSNHSAVNGNARNRQERYRVNRGLTISHLNLRRNKRLRNINDMVRTTLKNGLLRRTHYRYVR